VLRADPDPDPLSHDASKADPDPNPPLVQGESWSPNKHQVHFRSLSSGLQAIQEVSLVFRCNIAALFRGWIRISILNLDRDLLLK
jgi:hypothetical protein